MVTWPRTPACCAEMTYCVYTYRQGPIEFENKRVVHILVLGLSESNLVLVHCWFNFNLFAVRTVLCRFCTVTKKVKMYTSTDLQTWPHTYTLYRKTIAPPFFTIGPIENVSFKNYWVGSLCKIFHPHKILIYYSWHKSTSFFTQNIYWKVSVVLDSD